MQNKGFGLGLKFSKSIQRDISSIRWQQLFCGIKQVSMINFFWNIAALINTLTYRTSSNVRIHLKVTQVGRVPLTYLKTQCTRQDRL